MIKKIIKKYILELTIIKKISIATILYKNLFHHIITNIDSHKLREALFLPTSSYSSQNNQDIFALLFNKMKPGFFIEIGANDGFTFSNTVYLEEKFQWKGLLIEANPKYLSSLEKRKNSLIINKAIFDTTGYIEFVDAGLYGGIKSEIDDIHSKHTLNAKTLKLPCDNIENIFKSYKNIIPDLIDFISIDVEGVELMIVKQLLKTKYKFKCGVIEVNNRSLERLEITKILNGSGYFIDANYSQNQDIYFYDPIFL